VTIIPRGMALGATMSLPEKERYAMSFERSCAMLSVLYGGRIAERKFLGSITTGAENDIERATDLATNMVVRYGFSEILGAVNYAETEKHDFLGGGLTRVKGHSDQTSLDIDKEIRKFLDDGYRAAEDLIDEHREQLEAIAQALLKYETLDAKDVVWVVEGKPIEEKRKKDQADARSAEAARKLEEIDALGRRRSEDGGAEGVGSPRHA